MPRGNPEAYMRQGMPPQQAMRRAGGAGPGGAGSPSVARPMARPGGGMAPPMARPSPGGRPMGGPRGRPSPQGRPQGRPQPAGGGDIKVHVQQISEALKAIAALTGVELR